MPDIILKFDGVPQCQVFLDGFVQTGAVEVNLTQGYVKRAFTGEPGPAQTKVGSHGYVFDLEQEDFVLETVKGEIHIDWVDKAAGRAWLERHGDA